MTRKTISFKVTDEEAKRLYQQAESLKISPHLLARSIVIEGLSLSKIEDGLQELAQRMEGLQEMQIRSASDIEELREDVSLLLARESSRKKATGAKWIEERFR